MLYFTSDHHFWHANIIRYCNRPFATIEEMNESMIMAWNEVVSPNDDVYYLGDFSLALRSIELYTTRLNGTKYFMPQPRFLPFLS
jgi:calcineurin-like phosphoesterase family protein